MGTPGGGRTTGGMGNGDSQMAGIFSHWRQWGALVNVGHWEMRVRLGGSAGVVAVPSSSPPHFPCTTGPKLVQSPATAPPEQRSEGTKPHPGPHPATAWGCCAHPDKPGSHFCRVAPSRWVPVTLSPTRLWLQTCSWLALGHSSPNVPSMPSSLA